MIPVLGQDMLKFEEACLKQLVLKIQTVMHLNVFRMRDFSWCLSQHGLDCVDTRLLGGPGRPGCSSPCVMVM